MLFSYRAYSQTGDVSKGLIEAADERAATRALLEKGLFVQSISPSGVSSGLSVTARASLYRELSALLAAGLTLDRSLELLRDQLPEASVILSTIADGVRSGRGFASSIAKSASGISPFEQAAIASAEASASLPDMLVGLAAELEAREQALSRLRSALVYPCFVLVLGVIIAAVMLGVVVPKTSAMLASAGVELPASSQYLVTGARLAVFALAPTVLLLSAVFAALKLRAKKDRALALSLDKLILRLPGASFMHANASRRFAAVLAALVKSGMPLPQTLPLAAASMGHPFLEEAVKMAAERIHGGESPSVALSAVPYVGSELSQWIHVGEAGGCLPAMLEVAAARLSLRTDRILSSRLALIEPILLSAVGLFVLALALALLLPVLSLTTLNA